MLGLDFIYVICYNILWKICSLKYKNFVFTERVDMPKKPVESKKYPLTYVRVREVTHELGAKHRKLFEELHISWFGLGDVFKEMCLGLHDEVLVKTVQRTLLDPLYMIVKCLVALRAESDNLKEKLEFRDSQNAIREKFSGEGAEFSHKFILAFQSVLDAIVQERNQQKSAIALLEKQVHAQARVYAEQGRAIHKKLMDESKVLAERLTYHEQLLVSERPSDKEEIEEALESIDEIFQPWKELLDAYKETLDNLENVYMNHRTMSDTVTELSDTEDRLFARLREWERLFHDVGVNPYDILGIIPEDQEEYTQEESSIHECRALLNIALPTLPQVKSLAHLSERTQKFLDDLEEKARLLKPVFQPPLSPKLVVTRARPIVKKEIKEVRAPAQNQMSSPVSAMQLALAAYSIVCTGKKTIGRTAKVVYRDILEATEFTFGVEYEEFYESIKTAHEKKLMDLTRQWGKWIWKPTAEGFKMGATLIPFLPKDFEEKVKIALVELNEYQREMTAEYRRKKSGKNSAS